MIRIDLASMVGRHVLVQFRVPFQIAVPTGAGDEIDTMPKGGMAVDVWPFLVEVVDDSPCLTFMDPSGSRKLVLKHLPAELVAFVTTMDNTVTQEIEAPSES